MAGINQGRPEAAIGEPIRFGDDLDFEIEQHPISDRLIIRDTANGKEAYVRADRGGTIGGDGVLIKALKEGKPVADDGRTHDTIQEAERAASSFVFVPPGTFNESVGIKTEGLTLRGSGYNTKVDGGSGNAITVDADNVTVRNLNVRTDTSSNGIGLDNIANEGLVEQVVVERSGRFGVAVGDSDSSTVQSCVVESAVSTGIFVGDSCIVTNCITTSQNARGIDTFEGDNFIVFGNIVQDTGDHGIKTQFSLNGLIGGNRVINSSSAGIRINQSTDSIIFNNRISDSSTQDIDDDGTGTLLDGNLTGPSN